MKTVFRKINLKEVRMKKEYDFSKGVRGAIDKIPDTQMVLRALSNIVGWADTTTISKQLKIMGVKITPSNVSSILNVLHKKLGYELLTKGTNVDKRHIYKLTANAKDINPDALYHNHYLNKPKAPSIKTYLEPEVQVKEELQEELVINVKIQGKIDIIFSLDKISASNI